MRIPRAIVGVLLLSVTSVTAAEAQVGRSRNRVPSLDRIVHGDGRLEVGRDTRRLDRARVLLRRNGDAEVRFYRDSTAYVFTGDWTEGRSRELGLRLTRRDRSPISATGRVYLRGDEVSRIEINGREQGERLSVSFSTGRGGRFGSVSQSSRAVRGDGRLEIGSNTTRSLDRAQVFLHGGGRAEVRLYRGSTPYVFTGRWSGHQSRGVDLQLVRRDRASIRANGQVDFGRGGEPARIEISGREGRERLFVSFRADDRWSSQGPFGSIRRSEERRL